MAGQASKTETETERFGPRGRYAERPAAARIDNLGVYEWRNGRLCAATGYRVRCRWLLLGADDRLYYASEETFDLERDRDQRTTRFFPPRRLNLIPDPGGSLRYLPPEPLPPASRFSSVSRPHWADRPTEDELLRLTPKLALDRGLRGRVLLDCVIARDGRLRECRALRETPRGVGFAAAARQLSKRFRFAFGGDDRRIGEHVRLPIGFPPTLVEEAVLVTPNGPRPSPCPQEIGPVGHGAPDEEFLDPVFEQLPETERYQAARRSTRIPQGRAASAELECRIGPDRHLVACAIVSENPAGLDAGQAALSLAEGYRVKAYPPRCGRLSGRLVRLAMTFGEITPVV